VILDDTTQFIVGDPPDTEISLKVAGKVAGRPHLRLVN
jgi:hypothetical protein